mmetsp:Transcript_26396/g.12408  ORF Transcript_26396/g.12408 Transcript_26396/m.12408 type:complete len:95 (-) Transcript_26396:182-466(-)
MTNIIDPSGFVSSGLDKRVKIWSRMGEPWGEICLERGKGTKFWNFPFDWNKKRIKDLEKVIEVLNLIEDTEEHDLETVKKSLGDKRAMSKRTPQ